MKYELSRDEMHYLLKGEHVSVFGKGSLSEKEREKAKQKLITKGLIDINGVPVPRFAPVLVPIVQADDDLVCPFPFEDFSSINLRSGISIKAGKITAARKEGKFRVRFILEALDHPNQAEQAISEYLGLRVNTRHSEPFSLFMTGDEAEILSEACLSGDLQIMNQAAKRHNVPIETLIRFFQEVVCDTRAEVVRLLAARRDGHTPGTLILKIQPESGLVFRWIMGVPGLTEEESIVCLEEIPEGNLLSFLTDYKGY